MEQNIEYWEKVRQKLYKQVMETNWGGDEERVCKPRGRKPKPRVVAEQKLRVKQEHKFFNFN
jgi:hypothetical protein